MACHISKSDLQFKDYSWTAMLGDNPKITGPIDSTMFSRHEGYEVLYLINKLCEEWRLPTQLDAYKMEKMIHDHLPSNIRSQENVKAWIKDNW